MFAVPGWSLSADKLKTETAGNSSAGTGAAPATQSRKRKRSKAAPSADVTRENVTDLWERIIEHKETPKPGPSLRAAKDKKRQKVKKGDRPPGGGAAPLSNDVSKSSQASATDGDSVPAGADVSEKKDKKNKKDKKHGNQRLTDEAKPAETSKITRPAVCQPPPPPPPKLTPLQASMRAKLISARFRHLNETLYTRPSEEAFKLFDDSPEMFSEYHEGFRQQVGVWPENPVDRYIADIRARAAVRPPSSFHSKNGRRPQKQPPPTAGDVEPLPRTAGTCTVADLGCGDGRLGSELQPLAEDLRLQVLSFDLHSPAPHVTKADMANVPLPDGSVNVAVFCLALMGTNWPAFVEEAYRLLHWKGELWVAEIKSRFAPAGARGKKGAAAVVDHSVGKRRKKSAKAGEGGDANGQAEDLAVEVDGADDRRGETDVSAFVEILTRRGFVLHGSGGEGIDLSNKMFVKMRFIKAAAPTVGKGAPNTTKPLEITGLSKKRVPETPDAPDMAEEAKVLKPCVYKIR